MFESTYLLKNLMVRNFYVRTESYLLYLLAKIPPHNPVIYSAVLQAPALHTVVCSFPLSTLQIPTTILIKASS